jgi:hypothetical protein
MPKSSGGISTTETLPPTTENGRPPSANKVSPSEQAISLVVHVHVHNLNELTPDHAARLKEWLRVVREDQKIDEVQVEPEKPS